MVNEICGFGVLKKKLVFLRVRLTIKCVIRFGRFCKNFRKFNKMQGGDRFFNV